MRWIRSVAFVRFIGSLLLPAVLLCSVPAVAQSSDETGLIVINVVDAASKKALADARITLYGATQASALTNRSGIVKYTDVPSGLYRVRVGKSGFSGNTSAQFEILGNKEVDVDVTLVAQSAGRSVQSAPVATDASGLKVIGHVSARVAISTHDVEADSAIRKVSDSLTDALSKIAGVDVTQAGNDPDAAQTISLNGHDESQTAVTLDGIPLGAPGSAVNLRGVNTDLFSGAGVSFAAQAGSLGGSVNFRTLQPTQTWITRLASSYGTFDKFTYQLGETGSIGKLGIAMLHTQRESNNPLTFTTFADASGFTYAHAGESNAVGNFLKLRYGLGDKSIVNVTALQNNLGIASLCTQDVTILPCGYGPGNTTANRFELAYATVQSLIGEVTTSLSVYVNSSNAHQNDALRYLNGVSSPLVSNTKSLARGVAFLSTVNQGRSTWTFNGSTYDSLTSFDPIVTSSAFVVPSVVGSDSQTFALSDFYKLNDRLSIGPNASVAATNGTGASILGGLSASWRPQPSDSFAGSLAVGSSQPAGGIVRSLSDPAAARFNCLAGTANVSGPGDQPGKQSALSYDANWTHVWKFGSFTFVAYRQTQADQLINAQIVASSLGFTAANPYVQDLQAYFDSPDVCGAAAVLSPQNVYVSEPVGDTTRRYEGFTLSGRVALGPHLVVLPSYSTNGAEIIGADARLAGLNSTTIVGAQIPGRPIHRANVTLDGDIPHAGLELLANVQYVGSNNAQHLDPYALLSLGASHTLGSGKLSVLETNVFNTESGAFSTLAFAQPVPTSGGGLLYVAANPNPPRQLTLSYSLNTGASPGAGGARPSRWATMRSAGTPGLNAADGAAGTVPQRTRGLGLFRPFPAPPGVDPLAVAEQRDSCTPADAQIAAPVLQQLRVAAAAFAERRALPAVDGLSLVPHGDPAGAWYFEVRPNLPPRAGAGNGERSVRSDGSAGSDQSHRAGFGMGAPGEVGSPSRGGPGAMPSVTPSPSANVGAKPAGPERLEVASQTADGPRPRPSSDPAVRAGFAKLRATLGCSYFSVLDQADAKRLGFAAFDGHNGLGYGPHIGLFAVRAPELGTGGGSLKRP